MCFSTHLWFCAFKTATLEPEYHVSMGPSPYLWFCAFKRATLGPELHISRGPRRHLWFFACQTACLASELLISMGSSPHLSFLDAKHRLWTRITSLYGSQTTPVVLCMQNSSKSPCYQSKNYKWVLEPIETSKTDGRYAVLQAQNHRIISLSGSQTQPVVLCIQNSVISTWITSLYVSKPSSVVFACKTATFWPE